MQNHRYGPLKRVEGVACGVEMCISVYKKVEKDFYLMAAKEFEKFVPGGRY